MDFGKNECEDGNIINGDGCSSTCEMEKCYECKGGTINTKDVCSLLYIKATLSKGAISNTYDINFSSEMKQISVSLNDLLVTVSSKYSILYTWSANFINEKVLRISIETNYVLIGDETVSIKFINYKEFRGPYGGCLVNTEIISNASGNLKKSEETASSFSVFAKYSAYFGIIVTIILIIFGGGSFETFWALLNSMQIISYLPLMTPYFPQHVRIMFQVLKFSNLNFDFLSDIFMGLLPFDFGTVSSYSDLFTKNGISTPLFLENCASILFSLLSYISVFLLSCAIYKFSCCTKMQSVFKIIVSSFLYNNFLRFMTEGYLEITFGCILNVYSTRIGNSLEITSFLTSMIFGLFCIVYPFIAFALIYDNRKSLTENEEYIRKYGTLFKHLKVDCKWYQLQFYPIFLVRRLVFVILLISLEGYPEIQCNVFIVSSLGVSRFAS